MAGALHPPGRALPFGRVAHLFRHGGRLSADKGNTSDLLVHRRPTIRPAERRAAPWGSARSALKRSPGPFPRRASPPGRRYETPQSCCSIWALWQDHRQCGVPGKAPAQAGGCPAERISRGLKQDGYAHPPASPLNPAAFSDMVRTAGSQIRGHGWTRHRQNRPEPPSGGFC